MTTQSLSKESDDNENEDDSTSSALEEEADGSEAAMDAESVKSRMDRRFMYYVVGILICILFFGELSWKLQ